MRPLDFLFSKDEMFPVHTSTHNTLTDMSVKLELLGIKHIKEIVD